MLTITNMVTYGPNYLKNSRHKFFPELVTKCYVPLLINWPFTFQIHANEKGSSAIRLHCLSRRVVLSHYSIPLVEGTLGAQF